MKKSHKISLVLVTSLMLIGCGDDNDPPYTTDKDKKDEKVDNTQVGSHYVGGGFYPWFYNIAHYSGGRYIGPEPSLSGISSASSRSGSFSPARSGSFSSVSRGGFGGSFSSSGS